MITFTEWLKREMASFELPDEIEMRVPTEDGHDLVFALDMYFERHPRDIDKVSGKTMNQGSKFVAKEPFGNRYLVYNGVHGPEGKLVGRSAAEELAKGEHNLLPNDWWRKAMIIGSKKHKPVKVEPFHTVFGGMRRRSMV